MAFDRGTKSQLVKTDRQTDRQTDLNSYKAEESHKQNIKGVP